MVREDQLYFTAHTWVAVLAASFSGAICGYNSALIENVDLILEVPWSLSIWLKQVITSSFVLGATVGCVVSGPLADKIGRKKCLALILVLGSFSAVLSGIAWHWAVFMLFRFTLGMAGGATGVVIPTLLSEIVSSRIRGRVTAVFQVSLTLGILLAYLVGSGFLYLELWQPIAVIGVIPFVMVELLYYWIPESPRWLSSRRGYDVVPDSELNRGDPTTTGQVRGSYGKMFTTWRKCLLIGLVIVIGQQLTGINAIILYNREMFEMANIKVSHNVLQVLVGVINFLCTLLGLPLVDRFGRRPLLLFGFLCMVLSCFLIAISFFVGPFMAILGIFLFLLGYECGPGPLFFVILAEISAIEIKGQLMSFFNALQWSLNFCVSLCFLSISHIPYSKAPAIVFVEYGCIGLFSLICCYFLVPETKGRSLESIHTQLRS